MAQFLPIQLSGDNLGERHRYLNSRVHQAAKDLSSFEDISNVPELTTIDRLFKIDLANKLKHIEYIVKQLKDDDMLYVSRALKSNWLIEHRDVINPKYLEDSLFPEMVMPAISKMKHWLYIHVRDPVICQQFYLYYKDIKYDYAVKFLTHCDNEFLLIEFPKILVKITPHYLKVLGEKCPELVKIYFDSLVNDKELLIRYRKEQKQFQDNIKFLLKSDPGTYLDIVENKHNLKSSDKLSPAATDYIMRFHKSRFMNKPELYVVYLVHVPTAARRLSADECQDVVIKLARADYLGRWFSYKNVEPFIKRVDREKRAAFKKRVFVDKDIGERVTEWSYGSSSSSDSESINSDKQHVFDDPGYDPITLWWPEDVMGCCFKEMCLRCEDDVYYAVKSELQDVFNEFRYVGFDGALNELSRRIGVISSSDRRRDILLVLVSKSGGRAEAVRAVLEQALRLNNEPAHHRAAVVRSLVKRASAWRLPQDVWDKMLQYAHGLGLDGSASEVECHEGLHAVVLRQLLDAGDCDSAVRTAFLKQFSTLAEYKLVQSERVKVVAGLQHILTKAASAAEPAEAAVHLVQLFDVFQKYQGLIKSSTLVASIAPLAERDVEAAKHLLLRLYEARVGRRELLRHYIKIRHDDGALLNVLRHEPGIITPTWVVKLLAAGETSAHQYLSKLAVYFNEVGGTAQQIQLLLREKIAETPDVKLARPVATLAGNILSSLWREQDEAGGERHKLAAALRAHMHRARPPPDALALGWRQVGMKAVAWRAMRCRPAQVTQLVQTLLQERVKRTVRLALTLAQRVDCAADMFSVAVTIRPLATLRAALLYYRKFGDAADPRIWDIVRSLLAGVDLYKRKGLRHCLEKIECVPSAIKPDYCALLCLVPSKTSESIEDNDAFCYVMKHFAEVSDDLQEKLILRMFERMDHKKSVSYPAIVIKYLMLSKSNDELKVRLENVGEPFLAKMILHYCKEDDSDGYVSRRRRFFSENLEQIMNSLQYNFAFFDTKYEFCLPVIERVLTWMQNFMPKETHFIYYVKIHATMLYYKAVRQSIKQNPEVFADRVKKMSEGVDIVGFTFGRYIAKEVTVLKSQYFDSIIEIYNEGLKEYLADYFGYGRKEQFLMAIIKGILSESVTSEARLAINILHSLYNKHKQSQKIEELIMKSEVKEIQFFFHAEILG